ncbi:MAG: glycoside hydrolase family 57 protein [Thermoanaerobaculales bacterium]|jgi:alpha-amylase/alpha-mannosidase (GH57 family)|nr:glycoside hydrolase family 57 protein [Thermoanaerobaculales bacterium]
MAKLSFLWHLHQPCYRTADGVAHAPWAAVHAGGAYRTLADAVTATGGPGHVLNVVPSLLEQLIAYRDGKVHDPVMEAFTTPVGDLTDDQREILISWAFHVTPRQLQRYPRLAELASRRRISRSGARLAAAFGPADLRDLQVLFVLAQAGEQAWTDPRLGTMSSRGRGFSGADHERVTAWLQDQPGELIELWREISRLPGAEISTSPFAHPIMPLLADTGIVVDSWAPDAAPDVPEFRHPEDAVWQLDEGLSLMRANGIAVSGCWPPEGSVSTQALSIYAQAGVRWLVTDEGILARSLDRTIREQDCAADDLYRPWTLDGPSPTIFFRDRRLSDAIGFTYGRWNDETRAAHALVGELSELGRRLPEDATIVLALDGENPWLHYPDGGGTFLRTLMEGLSAAGDEIEPVTLTTMAESSSSATLPRLHPGSWINSIFATWIGHPEKTAAWRLLAEVREAIEASGSDRPPSLLVAEASDWFWWLGDDNPTELAPLYDRIFRHHLADACRQAAVEAPAALNTPLKTVITPVDVPVSTGWREPTLDGRKTSYFEWCLATRVETDDLEIDGISLWGGATGLHLLIEAARAMSEVVAEAPVELRLEADNDPPISIIAGADVEPPPGVRCAVGSVFELSIPWDCRRPARLDIRRWGRSLLGGSQLLLEPMNVDESNRFTDGK